MTDEDWLELVGEAARAQRHDDAAILAQLEATEEGRGLLAALDEGARARIAATAFPAPPSARRAEVIAIRAGVALAAAAALALVVRGASPGAPLPPYEVAISGPTSPLRGAPGTAALSPHESITLAPASPLEIVLRPDQDVRGPVTAGAFLVAGATVRAWDAPIEVSQDGAVRIAGEADRLFAGKRGDVDVIVVVARPGAIPEAARAIEAITAHDGTRRAVRLHVHITP
jgi:hypothetical protein